jgi:anti-sigma-K factor RskA
MTTHQEKYLEYTAAYVLGALDGNELREFEDHLRTQCTICTEEVTSFTEAVSLLPSVLPLLSPTSALKDRIMNAAHRSARMQSGTQTVEYAGQAQVRPAKRAWLAWGLAFAVIVMAVVFSISYNSLLNSVNEKNEAIATQQRELTALRTELEQKTAILSVLESRRIEVVSMDGLQVNPVGYGKIIWDPEKKVAVLHVSHLPPVPKDKDYQLWVIKASDPKHPVSAGVFAVSNEEERENYFKVQQLEVAERKDIGAFAVTLEPKGGVPAPTGAMYLIGKTTQN